MYLTMMDCIPTGPHWSPQALFPSELSHTCALPPRFVLSHIAFLALPSLFRTPLGLYHLRLDHPGLERNLTAPESFFHLRIWAPDSAPMPTPYRNYVPGALTPGSSPGGARPQAMICSRCFAHVPLLRCFGQQAREHLCFHHPSCNISERIT
jgi:hypothetical protein